MFVAYFNIFLLVKLFPSLLHIFKLSWNWHSWQFMSEKHQNCFWSFDYDNESIVSFKKYTLRLYFSLTFIYFCGINKLQNMLNANYTILYLLAYMNIPYFSLHFYWIFLVCIKISFILYTLCEIMLLCLFYDVSGY